MLKNIDVMLNADLLHALRSMGHGDQIAVVDTNFPTDRIARQTVVGKALHVDNVGAARAVQAILSVMPLDTALQNSAGAWRSLVTRMKFQWSNGKFSCR